MSETFIAAAARRLRVLLALGASLALPASVALAYGTGDEPPAWDDTNLNDTKSTATRLDSAVRRVDGTLDASQGRVDTLLAQFDAAYRTVRRSDDNGSKFRDINGSELASGLQNVPFEANGGAYFRVTGAGDPEFDGGHNQAGKYRIEFELVAEPGKPGGIIRVDTETFFQGERDNIWINPEPTGLYIGRLLNVNINNVIGPGTGDDMDFILFTGLTPGTSYMAEIIAADFPIQLARFDSRDTDPDSDPLDRGQSPPLPKFTFIADSTDALFGVSGVGDPDFNGEHAWQGNYTLVLTPEPSAGVLLAAGAVGLFLCRLIRRQRARNALAWLGGS